MKQKKKRRRRGRRKRRSIKIINMYLEHHILLIFSI